MLTHILAILGLGLMCAGYTMFQLWAKKVDPDMVGDEIRLTGCGFCEHEDDCEEEGCAKVEAPIEVIPVARLTSGSR
jgi:hypothetical protein